MITEARVVCIAFLLSAFSFRAGAEDFTNAIHAYVQQCLEVEKMNAGIAVGIVDEHGSSIVSCGKLDNGTDQEVNGDTLFEIGSVTKIFTTLLLQDMIERGEMKLDDPVAKYLPKSVKVPTRNGKKITLLQLATHTSGLPREPDNFESKRAVNPYVDFTVEKLYAFLSGYKLTRDPGVKFEYSNPGIALLAQAIAMKAGTNYESFVVDRICRPLKMDSTRITLTPELKARFAAGHGPLGYVVPSSDFGALAPVGGLRSTANDMLKYVSANLGLTPSSVTPFMQKTHEVHFPDVMTETDIGLAWVTTRDPQGTKIVWHNGATDGYFTFAGFDKARRRGVVILCNSRGINDISGLGSFLLKSEWQMDRRPKEIKVSNQVYDSYVGQYQRSPKQTEGAHSQSGIGIRSEGGRLFAQATGERSWPVDVLLPPIAGELLPESKTSFFERLGGAHMIFSRDARGKVTGLTLHHHGEAFAYEKISDEPPKNPEPPKQAVAIKLATKLLDACVGHYEFGPGLIFPAGIKVTIWREGDQLILHEQGENAVQGAISIYPESETNFFTKVDRAQLTFIKNDKGEVTAAIFHGAGMPDYEGKKLKN